MPGRPSLARRLPDWEERFNEFLASGRRKPYALGDHDCMLSAAAAVEAVTGVDLGSAHRGKYGTKAAARRYLSSLGFSSPARMLDNLLEARAPAFARRGDLVLDAEGIPAVCIGGDRAVAAGGDGEREGWVIVPRGEGGWVQAWTVGEP